MTDRPGSLEERLRRQYGLLMSERPTDAAAPSDDEIVDLMLDRLSPDERQRVADRIVESPALADTVRVLMDVHREALAELGPLEGADTPGQHRSSPTAPPAPVDEKRRPYSRLWTVAGAVAATLTLVWLGSLWTPERTGTTRGDGPDAFAETPALFEVSQPVTLEWEPIPDALRYRVVVYDAESHTIWESETTTDTQVELPDDVTGALDPERSYLWRVFVRIGVEETSLPLRRFRLAP